MAVSRKRIRTLLATGLAVTAVAATVFAFNTAHASPSGFTNYSIANLNWDATGCLDADVNEVNLDGGTVQLFGCHGEINQRWVYEPVIPGGGYAIINEASGKCLDADTSSVDPSAGTARVQLWDCNYQDQQVWDIRATSDADLATLENRYATRVLNGAGLAGRFVLEARRSGAHTSYTGIIGEIFGIEYLEQTDVRLVILTDTDGSYPAHLDWGIPETYRN